MRIRLILLAGAVAGLMTSPANPQPTAEADVMLGKVSNQYICVFNGNVSRANVRAEANRAANPELGQILFIYEHAIRGFAVRLPADQAGANAAMGRLKKNNSNVAYCEQDQIVKAVDDGDPETPWGIERVGGYRDATTSEYASRRAWVIDSGIDLDHPDLNVKAAQGYTCVSGRGGMDDENGHGTHVARTIGAKDNDLQVVGVAAGIWVVPVRVLDRRGSGTWSCVIAGVNHVAANGSDGDVANMSLTGGVSQAVDDAVKGASDQTQAGERGVRIWFSLAAGNNGANVNNYSPARANGDYIRTIAATDINNAMASWSNYGSAVDYAEPGVNILSSYKGGVTKTLSGTSMAAPHHAGLLAVDGTVSDCGTTSTVKSGVTHTYNIGCH